MKKITVIYTNWRRKNNLKEIILNCKKQTITSNIIVIDNASLDENKYDDLSIKIIEKDNTLMCWERWLYAFDCDSEYVCIMDDDINFLKNDVLYNCYNYMENNKNIDAIGVEGVKLIKNKNYLNSDHYISIISRDIDVSIIKGRFFFVRKNLLNDIDRKPDLTCDDIKISSFLNKKILPSFLNGCFVDLPVGNESLSVKHYQLMKRVLSAKKYFKNY